MRTFSIEVGAGVVKPICVPPLKSIPRLSPRTPSARTETTITAAEMPNQSLRRPMKSILSHGRMPPPEVPITRGLSRSFEPASSERNARVASTAVSIEIAVPIRSISANPRTRRGGDREQHERGDRGDDVGVDDRREALRVAGLDRGPDAAPGARLFLDAFEDDDVRVGGHPQRQHEAGEAREGQRHVEDEDRGVEEGGVDAEAEHGDDAEEAVEDEQEERDEEEADDRRLLRLVERVLTERRRDRGLVERHELDRQRAGLEHEREVLRLLDRRRCR